MGLYSVGFGGGGSTGSSSCRSGPAGVVKQHHQHHVIYHAAISLMITSYRSILIGVFFMPYVVPCVLDRHELHVQARSGLAGHSVYSTPYHDVCYIVPCPGGVSE